VTAIAAVLMSRWGGSRGSDCDGGRAGTPPLTAHAQPAARLRMSACLRTRFSCLLVVWSLRNPPAGRCPLRTNQSAQQRVAVTSSWFTQKPRCPMKRPGIVFGYHLCTFTCPLNCYCPIAKVMAGSPPVQPATAAPCATRRGTLGRRAGRRGLQPAGMPGPRSLPADRCTNAEPCTPNGMRCLAGSPSSHRASHDECLHARWRAVRARRGCMPTAVSKQASTALCG